MKIGELDSRKGMETGELDSRKGMKTGELDSRKGTEPEYIFIVHLVFLTSVRS